MHTTEVETHKARKAHRCEWCLQRIDDGTEYKRYRCYGGGEASTVKMHPECYDAMQEAAREEGGYIEWTPGMERPLPANYSLCSNHIHPVPAINRRPADHAHDHQHADARR